MPWPVRPDCSRIGSAIILNERTADSLYLTPRWNPGPAIFILLNITSLYLLFHLASYYHLLDNIRELGYGDIWVTSTLSVFQLPLEVIETTGQDFQQ